MQKRQRFKLAWDAGGDELRRVFRDGQQVPMAGMTMEKTAAAMLCRSSIPLLGVSSTSSKTMLGTMGGGARENIFAASCLAVSLGGGLGGTTLGSRAQRSCRSSQRTCGSSDGIAEMRPK